MVKRISIGIWISLLSIFLMIVGAGMHVTCWQILGWVKDTVSLKDAIDCTIAWLYLGEEQVPQEVIRLSMAATIVGIIPYGLCAAFGDEYVDSTCKFVLFCILISEFFLGWPGFGLVILFMPLVLLTYLYAAIVKPESEEEDEDEDGNDE